MRAKSEERRAKNYNLKLKIKSFTLYVLVISFTLLALRFVTKQVNAQSASRSFTISPPSIHLTLKPGEKTEKLIKITNGSEEPLEFVGNVVDFIVTDKSGTPELLPSGTKIESKYAASTWSTVLPDTIIVQPGKTVYTTLYLQVPGDARPGGRYFAVTLRPLSGDGAKETGASVNSVVGSLVYLTVAGKTKEAGSIVSFSVPSFSEYGPIKISTEIKNTGDIHITPKATIEVKDIFGKKVFSTALANLNIFPGTSRIYQNSWETRFLFGRYKANLAGYFGQANNLPLTAMAVFWVIPYKLIAIILLAIAISIVGFFYFRKKQEPEEIEEQ